MIEPPRPFDPSGRPLPARDRWRARVVLVLGVGVSWLASLSGCGGATAGAPSSMGAGSMDAGGTKEKPGYELATLDDAQAALDSAESRLASFGVGSGAPAGTSEPPTQPHTQGQPGLSPLTEPAQPGVVQDRCVTACDALGSMRRAADRVCVLAPGERCDSASARVGAAEKRVFDACPGCSA